MGNTREIDYHAEFLKDLEEAGRMTQEEADENYRSVMESCAKQEKEGLMRSLSLEGSLEGEDYIIEDDSKV